MLSRALMLAPRFGARCFEQRLAKLAPVMRRGSMLCRRARASVSGFSLGA